MSLCDFRALNTSIGYCFVLCTGLPLKARFLAIVDDWVLKTYFLYIFGSGKFSTDIEGNSVQSSIYYCDRQTLR